MAENIEEASHTFAEALDHISTKLKQEPAAWRWIGAGNRLVLEDITQLQIIPSECSPQKLYDHQEQLRRLVICNALLRAYSRFWNSAQTPKPRRLLMCALFLVHEFHHIGQNVSSSSYRNVGESQVDFFARLDYQADARAISVCYALNQKSESLDKELLLDLLMAQFDGGQVFGAIETTDPNLATGSIEGPRLRRQLTWAFQYARAQVFPPERSFSEFALDTEVTCQLFSKSPEGLGQDLCDRTSVSGTDFRAPLRLQILRGNAEQIPYDLDQPEEVEALARYLVQGNLQDAYPSFRRLFLSRPELTGRTATKKKRP